VTTVAEARRAVTAALRAANLDTPELDARLLVAHALGLSRAAVVAASDRTLTKDECRRIDDLRDRRLGREPVARILGHRAFWSLDLAINSQVLDPRPETETVVEAALAAIDRNADLLIADLGTGSGAILLALLRELPGSRGIATDRSESALRLARDNADALGLATRCSFVACDFGTALSGPFDLVVTNPPYIPSAQIVTLAPEVRRHDPLLALDGGDDGLDAYRAIAGDIARLLSPDGMVVVEIGQGQAHAVTGLLIKAGLRVDEPKADLAGLPRAIRAGTKRG
jgi:release factor glutamine methyltransferase